MMSFAAAALDAVIAVAAEHDVAIGEGHRPSGKKSCRPRIRFGLSRLVERVDDRVVGPLQDVVELRAAHRLGFDEPIARRRAARRRLVSDEEDQIEVGIHADLLVLVGCPVEPQATFEAVEATRAEHDVVAREALHAVAAVGTADQDVVAGDQRNLAGGAPWSPISRSPPRPPFQPVVALVAGNLVVALVAIHDVVAEAAIHHVAERAGAAVHHVVAIAAEHDVVADAASRSSSPASPWMTSSPPLSRMMSLPSPPNRKSFAVAAVDVVIAAVAPHRVVVGMAGDEAVIALGAAEDDGVAEEVVVADEMHLGVESAAEGQVRQAVDEGMHIGVGQLFDQVGAGDRVLAARSPDRRSSVLGFDGVFRRQEDAGGQSAWRRY